MKKIIFLMFFSLSLLFAQKIDFNKMSAKEIANLTYKYLVNKLPMKLNRFEILNSMMALENKILLEEDVDLMGIMNLDKEYTEIISVLKRNDRNFDEVKFFKQSLKRKDLNNLLNKLKKLQMQIVCFKNKRNYALPLFLKKGGILEKRFIDSNLGIFIGNFTITKKDCKRINPNF